MIDFIQCKHGRKLLVGECVDDFLDRLVWPVLKWLLYLCSIQTTLDSLRGTSVTGKLLLQRLDGGRLCEWSTDVQLSDLSGRDLLTARCLLLMDPLSRELVLIIECLLMDCYHFCIRFPSIHLTISDRSHTISLDGSYPRVAFPVSNIFSFMIQMYHPCSEELFPDLQHPLSR